jgi:hypothetical protein
MPRAAEIALESGAIIYDALFLALSEDSGTVMVTADTQLLNVLEGVRPAPASHTLSPTSLASSPAQAETKNVLQPGRYKLVRGGQTAAGKLAKYLQNTKITGRNRTG